MLLKKLYNNDTWSLPLCSGKKLGWKAYANVYFQLSSLCFGFDLDEFFFFFPSYVTPLLIDVASSLSLSLCVCVFVFKG